MLRLAVVDECGEVYDVLDDDEDVREYLVPGSLASTYLQNEIIRAVKSIDSRPILPFAK